MKTEATETQKEDVNFPCLMISDTGNIYLITGRDTNKYYIGTRVHSECGDMIGVYSDCWDRNLTPYTGKVTLFS